MTKRKQVTRSKKKASDKVNKQLVNMVNKQTVYMLWQSTMFLGCIRRQHPHGIPQERYFETCVNNEHESGDV